MVLSRIKELCKENDISLSELADIIGVGKTTIGKWDKSAPSIDKIARVAKYFNTTTDYIIGVSDHKYNIEPTDDSGIISIQRARTKMSDSDRTKMDALLRITFDEAFKEGKKDET